jgi:argininosuccinate synthase
MFFERLDYNENNERILCEINGKHADMNMNIRVKKFNVNETYSLYNEEIASFGDSKELYSHKDAEGFINLFGLPLKVRAMMKNKNNEK